MFTVDYIEAWLAEKGLPSGKGYILCEKNGIGYINKWDLDIAPPTPKDLKKYKEKVATNKDLERAILGRMSEYPYVGEAADIAYKHRQKARRLVGKARKQFSKGYKDAAFLTLMKAVEPVEDAKDYDAHISAIKRRYPKPEKGVK